MNNRYSTTGNCCLGLTPTLLMGKECIGGASGLSKLSLSSPGLVWWDHRHLVWSLILCVTFLIIIFYIAFAGAHLSALCSISCWSLSLFLCGEAFYVLSWLSWLKWLSIVDFSSLFALGTVSHKLFKGVTQCCQPILTKPKGPTAPVVCMEKWECIT